MTNNAEVVEENPVDKILTRTTKFLGAHPSVSTGDFFRGYLLPLLNAIRDEYAAGFVDTQDQLDRLDVPDENLLEQAKVVVLGLGNLVDNLLLRAGYFLEDKEKGTASISPTMPADIKLALEQVNAQVHDWSTRVAKYEENAAAQADTDDDDDDEGDDADVPPMTNGVSPPVPAPAPTVDPVPAPAPLAVTPAPAGSAQ